jgi:hypothetical protein
MTEEVMKMEFEEKAVEDFLKELDAIIAEIDTVIAAVEA